MSDTTGSDSNSSSRNLGLFHATRNGNSRAVNSRLWTLYAATLEWLPICIMLGHSRLPEPQVLCERVTVEVMMPALL